MSQLSSGTALCGGVLAAILVFSPAQVAAQTWDGGDIDVTGANNLTLTGTLNGSANFTKSGTGTLTFGADLNTAGHTGGMTLAGGTLSLMTNLDAGFGTITTTGSVINFANGVIINTPINMNSNTTQLQVLTGSAAQTGIISQTGGARPLEKIGAGTLILTRINMYTGLTTISAGALQIQNASALGTTAAGTTVASGAALELVGGITVGAEALTLNGTGVANRGALRSISGNNVYGGLITLGSASRINNDSLTTLLDLAGGITGTNQNLTFGGAGPVLVRNTSNITTGTGTLTKDGTGVLSLAGTNTFTGDVLVSGGELNLMNGSALADTVLVTVNASARLRVFNTETIGNIAGAGNIQLGAGTGATLLTVGDGSDRTHSGVISQNAGIGSLTKQGTGTLTLSGANTYTGATTVNAGLLNINGSSVSAVTVNTGGTLGGTGSIRGDVTIAGGTLAPGLSPGTMTVGSLTLNSGVNNFELATAGEVGGATNDLIIVTSAAGGGATGNLTLTGGTVTVTQNVGFSSGTYTLVQYNGALTGAASNLTLTALTDGFSGALSTTATSLLLNVAAAADFVHWNGSTVAPTGAVVGGSGTWAVPGSTNFTNATGSVSGVWAGNGSEAIFGGAAGTVTLGSNVAPASMRFNTSGYTIAGGGFEVQNATGLTVNTVGDMLTSTISAPITGVGSLNKNGAGTLLLSANNAAFTGTTNVNAGILDLTGNLGGAVNVNSGGTLVGNGITIGGTVTNNAGGTINMVNGVVTNVVTVGGLGGTGGVIRVDVNATPGAQGADRLVNTGASTGTGQINISLVDGANRGAIATPIVLVQNAANMTFTVTGLPTPRAGVTYTFSLVGTNWVLGSVTDSIVAPAGGPINSANVANAINSAGGNVAAFNALSNMTPTQLENALTQIAGQSSSVGSGLVTSSATGALTAIASFSGSSGGVASIPVEVPVEVASAADFLGISREAFQARHSVWARGFGSFGAIRADAQAGAAGLTHSVIGAAVGYDFSVTPDWTVGFALSGSDGTSTLDRGLGSVNAGSLMAALRATGRVGQIDLSGVVAAGFSELKTSRTAPLLGSGELRSRMMAGVVSTRLEAGYRFENVGVRGLNLIPFAAFQGIWVSTPTVAETTQSAALTPFAVQTAARTSATTRGELGLRVEVLVSRDVSVFARAAYTNYVANDTSATNSLSALPGATFAVRSARLSPSAVLGGLGAEFRVAPQTTLAVRAEVEAATRQTNGNVSAQVTHRF